VLSVKADSLQHLLFYSLAGDAHPGQDGAPRKAILRYQEPHPYSYPPIQQHPRFEDHYYPPPLPMHDHGPIPPPLQYDSPYTFPPQADYTFIPPISAPPPHTATACTTCIPVLSAQPQPQHDVQAGQFANAGPPGYAYDPTTWQGGVERSVGSDEVYDPIPVSGLDRLTVGSRSEWSSPLPGAFDPSLWEQQPNW
jgi:hypothetical protein